jgi:hypothetical protein
LFPELGICFFFPLYDICASAISSPLFAIATPLLFLIMQYATRSFFENQCWGLHHLEKLYRRETDLFLTV